MPLSLFSSLPDELSLAKLVPLSLFSSLPDKLSLAQLVPLSLFSSLPDKLGLLPPLYLDELLLPLLQGLQAALPVVLLSSHQSSEGRDRTESRCKSSLGGGLLDKFWRISLYV